MAQIEMQSYENKSRKFPSLGVEFRWFAKRAGRRRKVEFASGANRADLSAPVYREAAL